MKKILCACFFSWMAAITTSSIALGESWLLTSGMPAPGLPNETVAVMSQVAANPGGRLALIVALTRATNRHVLYVQDILDPQGLRPVLVSGQTVATKVVDSIFGLRIINNGTIYFLSEFKNGGSGIVSVNPPSAAQLVFTSDQFIAANPGKNFGIHSFHVNQQGEVVFVGSTQTSGKGSLDVFHISGGQPTVTLTCGMVSQILPNCIGFQHPFITDTGLVYAGAYRRSGPLGLIAPLALVERNLTGTRVVAKEDDSSPAGGYFRSIPGAHGFKPLSSNSGEVYFVSDVTENLLELHKLTSTGIQKVQLPTATLAQPKVSVYVTLTDDTGLVALARMADALGQRKTVILAGTSNFREVFSAGASILGKVTRSVIALAASRQNIYAIVTLDNTNQTGLLQLTR
jgi:hypothetical protein